MKTLYNKWTKENYQVPELTYKIHFKRTKTVEAKIRRYTKNRTSYYLTTNVLEDKTIKYIPKGKNFTYEGMEEEVLGKDEELFVDSFGWVSKNGRSLYFKNQHLIHIKNIVPNLWAIKKRN